jgi:YD repeat-containing protein
MKRLVVFTFVTFLFTACDDNDPEMKPTDPEIVPVAVNYILSDEQLSEQSEAHEVDVVLSNPAEAAGTLEIMLSGEMEYGRYFTTVPAISGGKISLAVADGDTEVSFSILPVNNAKLNGNKIATFSIVNAIGSVKLGESVDYMLTLVDDELLNKPQSFVKNGSGLSQSKSTFEYNEEGLVSKIHWESKNPFGTTTGTNEYAYDESDQIIRITRSGGAMETAYTWDGGFIVKEERITGGALASFIQYEYNDHGQVEKASLLIRNPAGEFVVDTYTGYTYLEDGNVHKVTIYSFSPAAGEFVMAQTTTYEGYVEGHNPVQLEVLPNQSIQTKLPTYYSRQTQTAFQEYNVSYEFAENGNLIKKSVTGAVADSGETTYTYY